MAVSRQRIHFVIAIQLIRNLLNQRGKLADTRQIVDELVGETAPSQEWEWGTPDLAYIERTIRKACSTLGAVNTSIDAILTSKLAPAEYSHKRRSI